VNWFLAFAGAVLSLALTMLEEGTLCALLGIEPARIEPIGFVLWGASSVLVFCAIKRSIEFLERV
jgi:hypothetical protein